MITKNVHKKIGWVCSQGHKWQAFVSNRSRGTGCPICAIEICAKKRNKAVKCIETGMVYQSLTDAKAKTGFSHIGSVCNGKRKSAGGYHWKFV